jgi:hypothetical protein
MNHLLLCLTPFCCGYPTWTIPTTGALLLYGRHASGARPRRPQWCTGGAPRGGPSGVALLWHTDRSRARNTRPRQPWRHASASPPAWEPFHRSVPALADHHFLRGINECSPSRWWPPTNAQRRSFFLALVELEPDDNKAGVGGRSAIFLTSTRRWWLPTRVTWRVGFRRVSKVMCRRDPMAVKLTLNQSK